MDYEGPAAFVQPKLISSSTLKSRKGRLMKLRETSVVSSTEASGDDGSEDDYIDETVNKRKRVGKVRLSCIISSRYIDELSL